MSRNAPMVPLSVDFSREDRAAKGLRSSGDPVAPDAGTNFSAAEIVAGGGAILLLGECGAGKTVFGRRLAEHPNYYYVGIAGPATLGALLAGIDPGQVPVIDGVDRLGDDGPGFLAGALARFPDHVVVLGETAIVRSWAVPIGYQVHRLLPLAVEQRAAALAAAHIASAAALSPPAATPALFALALDVSQPVETAEDLIDAWLPTRTDDDAAFARLREGQSENRAVDHLLAARHLMRRPVSVATTLFATAPRVWAPCLASLGRRLARSAGGADALIRELLDQTGDTALHGALLAAEMIDARSAAWSAVRDALARIVDAGRLAPAERDRAARVLARGGDPRDLDALIEVPAGIFTLGSNTHPNSAPPHKVSLGAFRIGAYPVTNGSYLRFVGATGRRWVSAEGRLPERANAPATNLSWHDATAYCAWLTRIWRGERKIAPDERVRLPTEPEWERAARGDQPDAGETIIYPWGGAWNALAANAEQTGFNGPCAVGLFPEGRSPYGCYDMAGQVWEWTSTLWGADMTRPAFSYPYRDDGRENPDAPRNIRRVLRGGCFSSGALKAHCTYRGSLEPDGFWRGNGFRIVVAGEQ